MPSKLIAYNAWYIKVYSWVNYIEEAIAKSQQK